MYQELLEFEFTYEQLYDMTIRELFDTLVARRKGLAYRMWKEAYLTAWAVMGKKFPKKPKEASPELFPKPKAIEMPENLRRRIING